MQDRDAAEWRKDQCGAWMQRKHFNNTESEYGWKIMKITPDGPDSPENLEPFQWNNSFDIALSRPHCKVTAERVGLSPTQSVDQPHNTSR